MGFEAIITVGVLLAVLTGLIGTRISPDLVLTGGLVLLLLSGTISPAEALSGFSNQGMITVGVLFIVAAGLRETGSIWYVLQRGLGRPKSLSRALPRITVPTALLSGFLNNTPLVAMLVPSIKDWAKNTEIPVSKILIPLSYSAILGGLCTLIGTSTNLVINGMLLEAGYTGLNLFSISKVGIPCAVAGIVYLLFTVKWLIPDRQPAAGSFANPREYTVEMIVKPTSPLVNQTIEKAGLRRLPGMYLMEIERDGRILPAVSSGETLKAEDRLVFVGIVESVVDLQKIPGLVPATDQVFKLDAPQSNRCLIEAVVSNSNPLVNRTIREGRIRSVYNSAVIAVARNGERLHQKIGDITLRPGDTLLLESHPQFSTDHRNSDDFYLVSKLENSQRVRDDRAWISLAALLLMILTAATGMLSMLKASLLAATLMLLTRCLSGDSARKSIDGHVLLAIVSAFGIGKALTVSGAADVIASSFLGLAGSDPFLTLVVIYLVTAIFTEIITNNAAAVLMFPIAHASAVELNVDFIPFVITIMVAASASFVTPIGYQTNLMIYGPGGYRYTDFVRIGLPLSIIVFIITILLVPHFWPLAG